VFDYHKTPVLTEEVKLETRAASRNLAKDAALSIAEDVDGSCDPYNSTGQHVILEAKLRRKDSE
jgi:hypothetical protein